MKIENLHESYIRNHWVRAMAYQFHDLVPVYVKGERLVYLQAALNLVANDPDGFWINGYQLTCYLINHIHKDPKNRKSKLLSVEGTWDKDKYCHYKAARRAYENGGAA